MYFPEGLEDSPFNDYQCFAFYALPLARPAQAKIQMLTAICSIVKLIL